MSFEKNYSFNQLNKNIMGRGDKRTKKGKIAAGSFGNTRPQKLKKAAVKKAAPKKAAKKSAEKK